MELPASCLSCSPDVACSYWVRVGGSQTIDRPSRQGSLCVAEVSLNLEVQLSITAQLIISCRNDMSGFGIQYASLSVPIVTLNGLTWPPLGYIRSLSLCFVSLRSWRAPKYTRFFVVCSIARKLQQYAINQVSFDWSVFSIRIIERTWSTDDTWNQR